jgi:hypothetical protein
VSSGRIRSSGRVGELDGPAFSVAVGTVSDPLTTDQGVFLLEIRKRDKEPLRPYEDVRDEIAGRIYQGQIDREKDAWYQQQRRKAAVEVRLEEPKAQ